MMTTMNRCKVKTDALVSMDALLSAKGEFRCLAEGADNGLILVVYSNADEPTITIYGGDGPLASGERTYSFEPNYYHYIQLESGPFLQTSGPNKGYIVMNSNGNTVNAGLIQLP